MFTAVDSLQLLKKFARHVVSIVVLNFVLGAGAKEAWQCGCMAAAGHSAC